MMGTIRGHAVGGNCYGNRCISQNEYENNQRQTNRIEIALECMNAPKDKTAP